MSYDNSDPELTFWVVLILALCITAWALKEYQGKDLKHLGACTAETRLVRVDDPPGLPYYAIQAYECDDWCRWRTLHEFNSEESARTLCTSQPPNPARQTYGNH